MGLTSLLHKAWDGVTRVIKVLVVDSCKKTGAFLVVRIRVEDNIKKECFAFG